MKTDEYQQQAGANEGRVPGPLLSALTDGEASASEVEFIARHWAQSSTLRAEWHDYHLIGDVMRSQELAQTPDRDEALLAAVRRRLADEPVILAPAPAAASAREQERTAAVERLVERRSRRRWVSSAAMVAGVATVAVALMVSRQGLPGLDGGSEAARLAAVQAPAPGSTPVQLTAVSGPQGVQAVAVPVASEPLQPGSAAEAGRMPVAAAVAPQAAGSPDTTAEALGTGRLVRDEQLDRFLAAHRQFGGPAVPGQVLRSATSLAPAER